MYNIREAVSSKKTLPLTALATLVRLRVHARCHQNIVSRGWLNRICALLKRLAGYDAVDVWRDAVSKQHPPLAPEIAHP